MEKSNQDTNIKVIPNKDKFTIKDSREIVPITDEVLKQMIEDDSPRKQ